MPLLHSAVSELESHIYIPIAKQTAHKVINDLNITKVINNNIFLELGFTTAKLFKDNNHAAQLQLNKLKAQVDVNTNPSNLRWDCLTFQHALGPIGMSYTNRKRDYITIFEDPISKISLLEMHLPTYIQLNCTLTIADRVLAYELPSLLYRQYPPQMVQAMHVTYDFPIPNDILSMIYSLWKLKRFNKEKSFRTWLNKCAKNNLQFDINRFADKEEIVFKKVLIDSLFLLEYTDTKPQEISINRSVVQYEINFTVHVQFMRPDMLMIDYPAVLDNRLLPENMIPQLHANEAIPNLSGPYPDNPIQDYIKTTKAAKPVAIKFPFYDLWIMPASSILLHRSYKMWFSSIFLMAEETTITELPMGGLLDEENGYEFHPIVKEILKVQGKDSFQPDCIFNLSIFKDDVMIDPASLSIDGDLNVQVPCKDPTVERRIILSEITDKRFLNPKWEDLFNKYKEYLQADKVAPSNHLTDGDTNNARSSAKIRILQSAIITRRSR